jgi:hypothetical protein
MTPAKLSVLLWMIAFSSTVGFRAPENNSAEINATQPIDAKRASTVGQCGCSTLETPFCIIFRYASRSRTPPSKCQAFHGFVAAALHLAWPLTTPDRGLFLDSTYIPLRKQDWCFPWIITVVTQIFWAKCMQLVFENAI